MELHDIYLAGIRPHRTTAALQYARLFHFAQATHLDSVTKTKIEHGIDEMFGNSADNARLNDDTPE